LIWGATLNAQGAATATVGTSYTVDTTDSGGGNGAVIQSEYLTQLGAGSIAATWTQGTNNNRVTGVVAIKPSTAPITGTDQRGFTLIVPRTG
jgi:hypothetical protein